VEYGQPALIKDPVKSVPDLGIDAVETRSILMKAVAVTTASRAHPNNPPKSSTLIAKWAARHDTTEPGAGDRTGSRCAQQSKMASSWLVREWPRAGFDL